MDPHHSGSTLRSGVKVAAPQTIATNLSHLSMLFQLNGRASAYHAKDNPLGNPREGFLASHWMTGKRKQLFRAWYEEGSAVPLTLDKVTQVLRRLDSLAASEGIRPLDWLCHLRDGLCFNFCWVTGQRGDDAGKLTLDDLWCNDQGLRLMQLMPIPAAGQVLFVSCRGSKTHQDSRLKPFDLEAGGDPLLDYPTRLAHFLSESVRLGHPVTQYISHPLNRRKNGFKEAPYSEDNQTSRLEGHLNALGLNGGESGHSFPCGTLQAAHADGASEAQLREGVQMQSPAVMRRGGT